MLGMRRENIVNYLLGKYITDSPYTDTNIIGWLNTEGDLNTAEISTYNLIKKLQSGEVVENVELDGNKLKYKGGLTEADYDAKTQAGKLICLGEIYQGDKVIMYTVVDKLGRFQNMTAEAFRSLVYRKGISNYYTTDSGEVRRMPNQNVSKVKMLVDKTQKLLDIYPGISKNEAEEILRNNNFRVIYQSEIYKATKGAFESYGWRDTDGAFIWYTIDNMSRSIYKDPMLLLDCIAPFAVEDLESNKNYNIQISKTIGHRWIIIQGNNLLRQYEAVKKYNPTINSSWGTTEMDRYEYLDTVYCLDVYEDLERAVKEIYDKYGLTRKVPFSMLSHEIALMAMFITIRKSSYENKVGGTDFEDMVKDWKGTFEKRITNEIKSLIQHKLQTGVVANEILQYAHINVFADFSLLDRSYDSKPPKRKNGLMDALFKFSRRK